MQLCLLLRVLRLVGPRPINTTLPAGLGGLGDAKQRLEVRRCVDPCVATGRHRLVWCGGAPPASADGPLSPLPAAGTVPSTGSPLAALILLALILLLLLLLTLGLLSSYAALLLVTWPATTATAALAAVVLWVVRAGLCSAVIGTEWGGGMPGGKKMRGLLDHRRCLGVAPLLRFGSGCRVPAHARSWKPGPPSVCTQRCTTTRATGARRGSMRDGGGKGTTPEASGRHAQCTSTESWRVRAGMWAARGASDM